MTTRLRTFTALALAAGMALGGCIDNHATIEFFGLCAWELPVTNVCPVPAGNCTLYQDGYIWAQPASGIDQAIMIAQFNNQRPNNADAISGRVNGADAQITKLKYSYTSNPAIALAGQTILWGNTPITAGGSATTVIPIVPTDAMTALRAALYVGNLEVEITASGVYSDGSTFEVAPFRVPVRILGGTPAAATCATAGNVYECCPAGANLPGFREGQLAQCVCATPQ